ncbi:MAG TPA: ATP-binding protein [Planctomycetota bacterium]|nr:ATP-binding protein [Planctomycetota bacterium]
MPSRVSRPAGAADRQLESRLKWLMFGRLAIAVIGIFVTLLVQPLSGNNLPPHYTLLAACLLNLVYLFVARAGAPLRPLASLQLVLDVAVIGALTYLTGIDRFFAFLFFATVIAAAMIVGLRMAIGMASSASIVLAAVSTLYFLATSREVGIQLPLVDPGVVRDYASRREFVLPYLFFFALSLHVVALLAGRLTAEVSRVRILNDEILQNMAGGVLAADRFGEIQFINAQAARLLGIGDPESARGRQFDRALPPKVAELLHRATRSEDRVADEIQVNGSPVRVAVSCLAEGEGGPLRGVVAMLSDLSLRTQMEEMTRRADRFKALLEMSAAMAHEIRNPLASIRGAAQELQTSKLPHEDDRQLLQVVVRESDRLDQIISEFLDYASDRPMDMGLFDLSEVLQETALLLEARRDPRVKIHREIPRSMLCRGSPDKLKQVFLNLGLNAIDACTMDGRSGSLTIRCAPARGSEADPREGVRVEFEDDGCGVPEENLGRVFDPFFTTKPQGVGMGLAIARKIVHAHGGEITLESRVGKETVVKVWLPV